MLDAAATLCSHCDVVYRERARLIANLAARYPAVISANDPKLPDFPVIYIDTPAGQISYHIHPDNLDLYADVEQVPGDDPRATWDGHDTDTKNQRLALLSKIERAAAAAAWAQLIKARFQATPYCIVDMTNGARLCVACQEWTAADGMPTWQQILGPIACAHCGAHLQ